MTSFSGEVVRKKDVSTAKNYLLVHEIETLNLLVSQFLDFAELQAKLQKAVRMSDWLDRLDQILQMNGLAVLNDAGQISARVSEEHAHAEYALFDASRKELQSRHLEDQPDVVAELESAVQSLKRRPPSRKS